MVDELHTWRLSRFVWTFSALVSSTLVLTIAERRHSVPTVLLVAGLILGMGFVLSACLLGFRNSRPISWSVVLLDAVVLTVLVDACVLTLILGSGQRGSDDIAGVALLLLSVPAFLLMYFLVVIGAIVAFVSGRPTRSTRDSGNSAPSNRNPQQ